MPVRVYLLKHTANETLERTTGEQDLSLEPGDTNKRILKVHLAPKFFFRLNESTYCLN